MREKLERLTVHNCRLRTDKFINFFKFFVLGHNGDINLSFFVLGGAHPSIIDVG
jgi:hypothetical protein